MNKDTDNYDFGDLKRDNELDANLKEKWIVSFISRDNLNKICYRQFYAAGFYEAYDTIMSFVEKTDYKILWYNEKRKCGKYFTDNEVLFLESICTFCNKRFCNTEPIKCNFASSSNCKSEFCSFKCKQDHFYHIHVKRFN